VKLLLENWRKFINEQPQNPIVEDVFTGKCAMFAIAIAQAAWKRGYTDLSIALAHNVPHQKEFGEQPKDLRYGGTPFRASAFKKPGSGRGWEATLEPKRFPVGLEKQPFKTAEQSRLIAVYHAVVQIDNKLFDGRGQIPLRMIAKIAWDQGEDIEDRWDLEHDPGDMRVDSFIVDPGTFQALGEYIIKGTDPGPDVQCPIEHITLSGMAEYFLNVMEKEGKLVRKDTPGAVERKPLEFNYRALK